MACLEAIDGRRHRSAGEIDAAAQLADGLRTFVQQRFEDGEVREAHVERFDAALCVTRQRAVRFHEDQPGVNTGLVSSSMRHGPSAVQIRHASPTNLRYPMPSSRPCGLGY